jgi:hypothetical protein
MDCLTPSATYIFPADWTTEQVGAWIMRHTLAVYPHEISVSRNGNWLVIVTWEATL